MVGVRDLLDDPLFFAENDLDTITARLARIAGNPRERGRLLKKLTFYMRLTETNARLPKTIRHFTRFSVLLDFDVLRDHLTDYRPNARGYSANSQNQAFLEYLFYHSVIPFSIPEGTIRELQEWLYQIESLHDRMQMAETAVESFLPELRKLLRGKSAEAGAARAEPDIDLEGALASLNVAIRRVQFILNHPHFSHSSNDHAKNDSFQELFSIYLGGVRQGLTRNNRHDALNLAIVLENYRQALSRPRAEQTSLRLFLTNTRELLELAQDYERSEEDASKEAEMKKDAVWEKLLEDGLDARALLAVPCANPRDVITLSVGGLVSADSAASQQALHAAFAAMCGIVDTWGQRYKSIPPRPNSAEFRQSAAEFAAHAVQAWHAGGAGGLGVFSSMENLRSTAASVRAAHTAETSDDPVAGSSPDTTGLAGLLRDAYAAAQNKKVFQYRLVREPADASPWDVVRRLVAFKIHSEPPLPDGSPVMEGREEFDTTDNNRKVEVQLLWSIVCRLDEFLAALVRLGELPHPSAMVDWDVSRAEVSVVAWTDLGPRVIPWSILAEAMLAPLPVLVGVAAHVSAEAEGNAKPPVRVQQMLIPTDEAEWTFDLENQKKEFRRYLRCATWRGDSEVVAKVFQRTSALPSSAITLTPLLDEVLDGLPPA